MTSLAMGASSAGVTLMRTPLKQTGLHLEFGELKMNSKMTDIGDLGALEPLNRDELTQTCLL